jgi:hypothetical protein
MQVATLKSYPHTNKAKNTLNPNLRPENPKDWIG